MEKRIIRAIVLALALAMPATGLARGDDFGSWLGVSAEKKLSKKWSVGLETEYRLRNSLKTTDRWSVGVGADYKILKQLKVSANYKFLMLNNRESINTSKGKWTPSYWGPRHRVDVSLTGNIDVGRFNFSLRERWQYTYRPETKSRTYDAGSQDWDAVKGKGKNVLRSRAQVEYNIPRCKVDPFASAECFLDDSGFYKGRYMVGAEWKITKQHSLDFSYIYQSIKDNEDFDSDPDMHIVSVAYKFKF